MPTIDPEAPLRFLSTAFEAENWVAVFLKSYETGRTVQRVCPLSTIASAAFQAWLRVENGRGGNVFISVNATTPGKRSRSREAICAIRHVFMEVDREADRVLSVINARRDLPTPSYVIHSSPDRVHVLWRATGFTKSAVEELQKHLARDLGGDPAATPCSQMTRLPGFLNQKYAPPALVRAEYGPTTRRYTPNDFPAPPRTTLYNRSSRTPLARPTDGVVERARRYLAALPPAIAGQHGDAATFRACCRLVRGFLLPDVDALALIKDWNRRCEPPWSERELEDKVRRARRYGREPLGGLLEARHE